MASRLIKRRGLTLARRRCLVATFVIVGAGTSACAVSAAPARFVELAECDDVSMCAAGFFLDDAFFAVDCSAIRPDVVGDRVEATGRYAGVETEVRQIEGVSPTVLLAIRHDGGLCDETRVEPLSPWSMVIPDGERDPEAFQEAVCVAAVAEDLDRNGCE